MSLSAISATDLENNETNNLEITESDDVLRSGETSNFAQLNEQIAASDSINLDGKSVKFNSSTDAGFANGIVIGKTVTIENGIIDGNNKARISKEQLMVIPY